MKSSICLEGQGLLHSLDFLKELLTLAKEVVQAEQQVDPVDEQARAKAALTELFTEVKNGQTPVVVERIVADIDGIVRLIRFPGWQDTKAGEREVQKSPPQGGLREVPDQRPGPLRQGVWLHPAVLLNIAPRWTLWQSRLSNLRWCTTGVHRAERVPALLYIPRFYLQMPEK